MQLEGEMQRAALALEAGRAGAAEAYTALQHRFEDAGGFTYEARLEEVLKGLGFSESEVDQPVSKLSGGQRSRLGLAKALLAEADLLLMDEPTNHLDFAGLAWLEDFLRRWPGTLVVTSHDRYFLDKVVDARLAGRRAAAEGLQGQLFEFQELRVAEVTRQLAEREAQQEYIAREEAFIRRYRRGAEGSGGQGQRDEAGPDERIEAPAKGREAAIKLTSSRTGKVVLSARTWRWATKRWRCWPSGPGGRARLEGGADRPERHRQDDAAADAGGRAATGRGVGRAGEQRAAGPLLAGGGEPGRGGHGAGGNAVRKGVTPQQARDLLGTMLFSGSDVDKPVGALSGGERSRLALAKLVTSRANVLLLDEPTNHLDIPSREALEAALASYEGTMVFSSHDRRLIATLATRLWLVEEGGFRRFDGTWEEYQESLSQPVAPRAAPQRPQAKPAPGLSPRRRAEELARIETEIEASERELAEVGLEVNAASARGDVAAVRALGMLHDEVQGRLDALLRQWEAAEG